MEIPYSSSTMQPSAEQPPLERDEPSVAHGGRWRMIGMIGFGLIGAVAIGAMVYAELSKPDRGSAKALNEETSVIRPHNKSKPYIAPPEPAPQNVSAAPANAPQSAQKSTAQEQMELLMQQEAYRQLKLKEKESEERIQSQQLIYDTPAGNASSSANAASSITTAGNISPDALSALLAGQTDNDDNRIPAVSASGSSKVGAEQLTDLHGLITQGTMISGIMETAISSNLPGMTRAIISEDVYSFDKKNLLIPTGSMLVGQYRSAQRQGQSRVFIIWNRLIRPDGVSINLTSYGTDSLGRSGSEGEVDTHFFERFGSSVMLSLIDAGGQVAVQSANRNNTNIALNTGNGLSRASEIALENSINIPPTIHVDQGERIKVFVGQDLDFSTVRNTAWHE